MTVDPTEEACQLLHELTAVLDDLLGADAREGHRAATVIRGHLRELNDAQGAVARGFALEKLRYDISGKGIHDRVWTPGTEARISALTDRIWPLLDEALAHAR